jgi:hypothetical protein
MAVPGAALAVRAGTRRAVLIGRELTVAVFVELLQSRRSVGDFGGGDDSVTVGIQYSHQRR